MNRDGPLSSQSVPAAYTLMVVESVLGKAVDTITDSHHLAIDGFDFSDASQTQAFLRHAMSLPNIMSHVHFEAMATFLACLKENMSWKGPDYFAGLRSGIKVHIVMPPKQPAEKRRRLDVCEFHLCSLLGLSNSASFRDKERAGKPIACKLGAACEYTHPSSASKLEFEGFISLSTEQSILRTFMVTEAVKKLEE